jgi:hypothetical protein
MNSAGAVGLAALTAFTTSCFTFISFDPDDGAGGGGTAQSAASVGGGPAGGGSQGGGDTGGAAPCTDTLTDSENCGECGRSCGAPAQCNQGICTAESKPLDGVFTIGIVQTPRWPAPSPVVGTMPASIVVLTILPPGLATDEASPLGGYDNGRGVVVGASDYFYYAPQLPTSCTGTCLVVTSQIGNPSNVLVGASMSDHVNGLAVVGDDAYFTLAYGLKVVRVKQSCLQGATLDCTSAADSTVVVSTMLGSSGSPATTDTPALLIDFDPVSGRLWWTTSGGCVHDIDPNAGTNLTAECALAAGGMGGHAPDKVRAAGAGVFVTALDDGSVYRVTDVGNVATATALPGYTWPIDADDRFLYAWSPAISSIVVVDQKSPIQDPIALPVGTGESAVTIEASDPDWLYFSTKLKLYRWRKPPAIQ